MNIEPDMDACTKPQRGAAPDHRSRTIFGPYVFGTFRIRPQSPLPESTATSRAVVEMSAVLSLLQQYLPNLPSWLASPSRPTLRHILYGVFLGFSLSITSTSLAVIFERRKRERINARFEARPIEIRSDDILSGVTGLIGVCYVQYGFCIECTTGNTPLVRINSLSDALGVEILGKAEVSR